MTWGAPIWFDLWLAGMAGGAYLVGFLVDRLSGGANKRLFRLATYLGIPLAVIGVILLIVDLGVPIRFWRLLTEFKLITAMSMGTWILMAWVIIAFILVALWWAERFVSEKTLRNMQRLTSLLAGINVVFAVLLMTYTGALLAISSQPLWAGTVILPSLFVVSAISTGVAILIITALIATAITKGGWTELKLAINQVTGSTDWAISNQTVRQLAKTLAVVIVIELVVLIGYAIWLGTSGMVGAGEALSLLFTGVLAVPFWIGVVLLALLVPFGLLVANWGKEIESKVVWRAIVASSACVIVGGLILRAVMAIGGQI